MLDDEEQRFADAMSASIKNPEVRKAIEVLLAHRGELVRDRLLVSWNIAKSDTEDEFAACFILGIAQW